MEQGEQGEHASARRASIVATIPAGYSPTLHVLIPALMGGLTFAAALYRLRLDTIRAADLLTVPLTLLGSFGFEWRAHKDILHRRMPLLGLIYERHELCHHVIFTNDDMAMRSRGEMWLILMPPYAIVLVFLALVLPFAAGMEALLGTNPAMLLVATSMLFFLSYEWLHLAYHLPPEHPISRLGIIARLREHHRRHHDPRLMKRYNFNVTVPLFDWFHRTIWSPEREALDRAKRMAAKAKKQSRSSRSSSSSSEEPHHAQ